MAKKEYETAAHASDGFVRKDDALILFRGALDHAEAEIILTQTLVQAERDLEEGRPAEKSEELLRHLQELLELLRVIMTSEYRGTELTVHTLFGYTLDELQERSHNAEKYYSVPTMTRPDFRFGEVYARLNLLRTELRQLEAAGVRLFCGDAPVGSARAVVAGASPEPTRPDLLYILNRLSSAAHVLMCWWLSER